MNTYADEGTLTSLGLEDMAESARFQTRFMRPHKFRFQLRQLQNGKEGSQHAVWSDGKKNWLYLEEIAGRGEVKESRLRDALIGISPLCGSAALLVSSLLFSGDFTEPATAVLSQRLSLLGEEEVSGQKCYVIGVSDPEDMNMKLWIDKSSYLIRQAFDNRSGTTILYHPQRDIELPDSEFLFSAPKQALFRSRHAQFASGWRRSASGSGTGALARWEA
jgi:outer membrane lipoprotein-sorting protein